MIDCWGPAVLALLTAPAVPSAQLFCPLVSVQNHVNRSSTHTADSYRVASPRNTRSDSEGNLTRRLQTLICSTLTLEHSDCPAVCFGAGTTITFFFFPLQGSSKTGPPATQLMRVKQPGSHSAVKREKRLSTSTFPLSANRELQKLLALAGTPPFLGDLPLIDAAHLSENSVSPPARKPLSGTECLPCFDEGNRINKFIHPHNRLFNLDVFAGLHNL